MQRDVQHWLTPPDPSTNHDFVWKAHHTGTASWFFDSDSLTGWKRAGSCLWIHGKRKICNLSARDSSTGPRRQASRRRRRPRLGAPRGVVFLEGYRSRGSDAAPTQAGVSPSSKPRASEAEGARSSRCAGANRPRVLVGLSRPGAGERVVRWAENESTIGDIY